MGKTTATDYRIIVGAFSSGDLASQLQALRERIDPKTALITPPHVTLAMRLKGARAASALTELRSSQWHADRQSISITGLQLMQRGPEDQAWRCIHKLKLA